MIRFADLQGKPIAFIVHYAVHNTVTYANRFNKDGVGISGDIAAAVSGAIEARFPGAVANWLPGASGNQNPILSNEYFTPNPVTGEQEVSYTSAAVTGLLKFYGKTQFADVLTVLSRIKTVSNDARVSYASGRSTLPAYQDGEPDFGIQLKVLRIGDIALAHDGWHTARKMYMVGTIDGGFTSLMWRWALAVPRPASRRTATACAARRAQPGPG